MFDNLSDKLDKALHVLKGHGKKLLHSRQPGTRSSRTRAGTQDVVGLINKINILLLFIHVV